MEDVFIHPTAIVEDGAKIGKGSSIWHFSHVRSKAILGTNNIVGKSSYIDDKAVLGNNVKIQNMVSVYNGVTIGDNVFVGPHVTFTNDMYPRIGYEWQIVPTKISDHVSIGANATIVCGSEIDDYAFIAAGTVLPAYRKIWAHALVMGNPGRIRGWVCKCGRKLFGDVPDGSHKITCGNCAETLTIEVKRIKKLDPTDLSTL